MPPNAQLTQREELILQAVVHAYMTTAEPVGSRAIVKRFGLDLSPATVRNVMADLEEAGFLEQVHTSSGRVPTDSGYRYYVNYLMRVQELTLSERQRIEQQFSEKLNDIDGLMRHTSQLLALVTHQTGIVEAPSEGKAEVQRIELMPVTPTRLAVLIIDNLGRVRTLIAPLAQPVLTDRLEHLTRFLNNELAGAALDSLSVSIRTRLPAWLDEQRNLAEQALSLLDQLPASPHGQLFLEGASRLFEQPEFANVARAREVFDLLDERDRIVGLLRAAVSNRDPLHSSIVIGAEAEESGLHEISVVASPYSVGDKPVGMLGILGPRRMPYSRLTAIVDYTADILGRFLTRLVGE